MVQISACDLKGGFDAQYKSCQLLCCKCDNSEDSKSCVDYTTEEIALRMCCCKLGLAKCAGCELPSSSSS